MQIGPFQLSFSNLHNLISTLDPHVDKSMSDRITSWIVLIDMRLNYEVPWPFKDINV
jgi:hypothetical protein